MIDRGSGVPVVLIPGIQGRWEWMAPAVDALAERSRVITFSLADEPTSGFPFNEYDGFRSYLAQIREALDRGHIEKAVIIGVSYSGLLATEFAARHPERVLGLVLTSALPPGWQPDARVRFYLRAPRLLTPIFWVTSPTRMLPELWSSLPFAGWPRFLFSVGINSVRAALSPTRMARRARWTTAYPFCEASTVQVPTLVITGEDRLDKIVKPELTRQYLIHLPHARHETLATTGHLGLVTKPKQFADAICRFANEIAGSHDDRLSA
jgi:3-oxoadipate enol-lactonase